MLFLRSLLFNCSYVAWTSAMHVVAIVPFLRADRNGLATVAGIWVSGILFMLRSLCGLDYREGGVENLPAGPAIFAVKHQSAWETLFLTRKLGLPSFVLKRELLSIPVFGHFLRAAGMIAIDRAQGTGAMRQMLRELKAILGERRSVVIFPEGTRVPPGERRRYHSGVAALYSQLGLPVVPVALNSGLFWGRRAFLKRPGTITVQYLPTIPPGMDRKAFMVLLEDEIETASLALARQ